jgi:hypothetical protein
LWKYSRMSHVSDANNAVIMLTGKKQCHAWIGVLQHVSVLVKTGGGH